MAPPGGMTSREAAGELHRLLNGFQITQAIHVAAALQVADRIGADPVPIAEIAEAIASHPGALYRLLRALAALGVFREHDDQRFSQTAMSECLRSDSDYPVGPHAIFVGQKNQWDAWGHLLHSVRTGENAFRAVHGMSSWDYRARNPPQNRIFNAAMTGNSRRVERAVVAAYDFSRFSRIADIGGGQGSMLAALMQANASLRGVLFDLPHVVAGAAPVLQAAGVADRCEIIGGDMLVRVPDNCDAYLLKYIIHDWDDVHSGRILRACRAAMPADGEVIVIDRLVGPPNEDAAVKLADLHMLVGPGGQERTLAGFAALLEAEGLRIVEVRPTDSPVSLLIARRV
ncbi:MAG TPA: methyltransferase [Casimicrobiaceae bacterium]|nr:methyltransferase [Casimicrobiaceae bacterium]